MINQLNKRAILFFCCIFIISACSLKTVYNQLDNLIPSYVEGLVSLDDILEEKLEQRTEILINWHRNTQLTRYIDLLKAIRRDVNATLTEPQVLKHMQTMQDLWWTLESRINEDMAQLLPLLNIEQREELFESISDKNDDFFDEHVALDEEDRLDRYRESISDTYEDWLDYLSDEQHQIIDGYATRLKSTSELRLERRLYWQTNIKDILDSDSDESTRSKKLKDFFIDFKKHQSEKLQSMNEENKKVLAQLTVAIINKSSAEQRAFFINKTDHYIRIFTELSENR